MKLKSNIGHLINKKGYRRDFIAQELGVTRAQISNWSVDELYCDPKQHLEEYTG